MPQTLLQAFKTLAKRTRWGQRFYWKRRIARYQDQLVGQHDMQKIFRSHLETNEWGSAESVSGPGSEIQYTTKLRDWLSRLTRERNFNTLLDAPCGDYNWMRLTDLPKKMSYIGGDLLQELVDHNQQKYGDQQHKFLRLDITHDQLPHADAWLCRDCLFHLSFADIQKVFKQFLESEIPYWLLTSHIEPVPNMDCPTGGFRPLNFIAPPFCFPQPIDSLDDWIPGAHKRIVGVWPRAVIEARLAWLVNEWKPTQATTK